MIIWSLFIPYSIIPNCSLPLPHPSNWNKFLSNRSFRSKYLTILPSMVILYSIYLVLYYESPWRTIHLRNCKQWRPGRKNSWLFPFSLKNHCKDKQLHNFTPSPLNFIGQIYCLFYKWILPFYLKISQTAKWEGIIESWQ